MNAILCFESWSQIIELIFDEGRWHPPKGDFIALYTMAMRCFIVSVRARVLSSLELEFIPQGGVICFVNLVKVYLKKEIKRTIREMRASQPSV